MNKLHMNHQRLSMLLTAAGIVVILVWAAAFLVLLPVAADECKVMYPEYASLYVPGLILGEVFGAVVLACLILYLSIARRIGRNESFCNENVKALKLISLLIGVCALMLLAVPLMIGEALAALYALILFLLLSAAAVLVYCISRLLACAVTMREENDLTI